MAVANRRPSWLNLVYEKIPDLADKAKVGVALEKHHIDDVIQALTARITPAEAASRVRAFRRLLQSAVVRRGWLVPYLPDAAIMPREASRVARLSTATGPGIDWCGLLEQRLSLPPTHPAAQGQILMSAALHGGLVDRRWWLPLLAALVAGSDTGRTGNGKLYVVLREDDRDNTPLATRIWIADQLTDLLIARAGKMGLLKTATSPEEALSSFASPELRPAVLAKFSRERLCVRAPGLIAAWAEGQLAAVCPREPVLARLLTNRRLKAADTDKEQKPASLARSSAAFPLLTHARTLESVKKQYRMLRRAIVIDDKRSRQRRSSEAKRALDDLLLEQEEHLHPVIHHLAYWCRDMLRHRSGRAGGRSKAYALGTVSTYLSAVGPAMLGEVGVDEPLSWDPDMWGELFETIIAATPVAAEACRRAFALRLFHDSLSVRYGYLVPAITFGAKGTVATATDAALLTVADIDEAIRLLDLDDEADERLTTSRKLVLILAYLAGLRRSEAWKLTLKDIGGEGLETELYVRPNSLRRLKYPASRRILPIGRLLEAKWLGALHDLVRQRRVELSHLPSHRTADAPLFAAESSDDVYGERDLLNPIQEALREASADPDATLHQARHAFGSRLLAMLLLMHREEWWSAFPGLGLSSAFAVQVAQVREWSIGTTPVNRAAAHMVSTLLGHVSVDTTMGSYVHVMSLLLAAACDVPEMRIGAAPDVTALWPGMQGLRQRIRGEMNLESCHEAWRRLDSERPGFSERVRDARGRSASKAKTPRPAGGEPLPEWRSVHQLLTAVRVDEPVPDSMAEAFGSARVTAEDIRQAAQSVMEVYQDSHLWSTDRRKAGQILCMRWPKSQDEIDLVDEVWKAIGTTGNLMKSGMNSGLSFCFQNFNRNGSEFVICRLQVPPSRASGKTASPLSPEEVIGFLRTLGIKDARIKLLHYASRGIALPTLAAQRREWERRLGLSNQCWCAGRTGSTGRNRVTVRVVRKNTDQQSYGFRYAMLLVGVVKTAVHMREMIVHQAANQAE